MTHASQKTILLADDEPVIVNMISDLLELYDYNVITAANGAEAVAKFNAHQDSIALCITDIKMPQLTGDQVVCQIRAAAPQMPFIIISGFFRDGTPSDTNVVAHMEKPLQPDLLIQKVQQMINQPPQPCK